MEISVFFSDNSELIEYEAITKGYRTDVFVGIENNTYHLRIYSMIRLQQDFESEIENYGYFAVEPNLVIVEEVCKDEIIRTVCKLFEQKYFDDIKPVVGIDCNNLIRVTKIEMST